MKPKGPLAAIAFGAPKKAPGAEPDEVDIDVEPDPDAGKSAAEASFRAVAKAFGLPPERWPAAEAALHHYVKACSMSEPDGDEAGEDEGY